MKLEERLRLEMKIMKNERKVDKRDNGEKKGVKGIGNIRRKIRLRRQVGESKEGRKEQRKG